MKTKNNQRPTRLAVAALLIFAASVSADLKPDVTLAQLVERSQVIACGHFTGQHLIQTPRDSNQVTLVSHAMTFQPVVILKGGASSNSFDVISGYISTTGIVPTLDEALPARVTNSCSLLFLKVSAIATNRYELADAPGGVLEIYEPSLASLASSTNLWASLTNILYQSVNEVPEASRAAIQHLLEQGL